MRRGEESAEYRHQRLQTLMFDELRASLRDDVSDAALIELRVTAVVLSVDCRHARVRFHGRPRSFDTCVRA
jgi:ribosome-binding factor A